MFPDDKLRRGVVLDMPNNFHDVIGVIHHLAEVDIVARSYQRFFLRLTLNDGCLSSRYGAW